MISFIIILEKFSVGFLMDYLYIWLYMIGILSITFTRYFESFYKD